MQIGDRVKANDTGHLIGSDRSMRTGETGVITKVEGVRVTVIMDSDGLTVIRSSKYLDPLEGYHPEIY